MTVLMLPYVFLGEGAFITIHDFLDSNPIHLKTLIKLGLIGKTVGYLPVMEGVSSLSYISFLPVDVKTILFILLPLYWAIVCNLYFVKIMAFLGMYLLCSQYIIKGNRVSSCILAIVFCCIPFYADYGLSSAGVPLLIYSVLNLESKRHLLISYLLIVLFACNSSLALVGVFVCLLWGLYFLYKWIKERQFPSQHFYGILILSIIYLVENFGLLHSYFISTNEISHRTVFVHTNSMIGDLLAVLDTLLHSQYHAGRFSVILVLLISFALFFIYGHKDKTFAKYIYFACGVSFLILVGTFLKHIPIQIFTSFQYDRFYFLYPTVCFILLAKAFSYIQNKKWLIISLALVLMFSTIRIDNELTQNVKRLVKIENVNNPSCREFISEDLFSIIKQDLGINDNYSCKVVSLGMHPSVCEYNGLHTLDGYVFSYPLAYKHKFRRVIADELEKDESLRAYFDDWGSRCYVFSSELGRNFLYGKTDDKHVQDLTINTNELKNLGCRYILSAVTIDNYEDLNLNYLNTYTNDDSYWKINVYEIN